MGIDFDVLALLGSGSLLLIYYLLLLVRVKRDPEFTVHSINRKARAQWVKDVMKNYGKKDVMAVQTLRNFSMSATFKASSSILLILGTLTLSGQAENMAKTWHVLDVVGSRSADLWVLKIMCLLSVLLIAFFAFAMCLRVLNHVVFMVNLPEEDAQGSLSPVRVGQRLNSAGSFYTLGMRAFFLAVPLTFWLFGPLFLFLSTVGLIVALYHLDRNPLAENI
ncbi:DUF599 domain-containing protein [Herminiimonas sp. NPDC097707]|uniref:DUF599 domain-containing protein n=1 Tax=Herminiimonas sp. NPDC097707 TaxID=3364007 RepID=UPI00383B3858